ncbi:ferritin-like domain-containing protein [Ramlibacter sp.]|uniref:ferritin-like domain-containing protein n=1 Tax=Ramlibacter sp. TaxID=1917967 RepID=UPI002D3FA25C|nr:ferritin-like domain-containing protein [Ramlibacter sp.]HYD75762.1 ferritin-like domain-containing protein [Ramlibacter sp.]
MRTARQEALAVLLQPEPGLKADMARALRADGELGEAEAIAEPAGIPGRPAQPRLVAPAELKPRSVHTPEGRAALIHALAHIELNAIDLAADIVWRFAGLPPLFYRQWMAIAQEEALHFQLLRAHLQTMGHDYGDFPAHNGLWEMAQKTRGDLLARLALVPRTLEARGLDASPPIKAKLLKAGDRRGAEILDIILRDEIGHVAVGNHWYRVLCTERGLDPIQAYADLAARYGAPRLRGPFNLEARRRAGFEEPELAALQG